MHANLPKKGIQSNDSCKFLKILDSKIATVSRFIIFTLLQPVAFILD